MVNSLVTRLKASGQDEEWYPTTDDMIAAVVRKLPEDTDSVMDIGAGDGRVLEQIKQRCKYAKLYSIEIAPILIQAQDKEIIPLGTDLFEQNLSALPVDYIFCNPKFSEYEEWTVKIIIEAYARKAFLVLPERWKDSNSIKLALNQRGATMDPTIYTGDFYHAERQSRAKIEIVVVRFPQSGYYSDKVERVVTSPFEIWFDQNVGTFDKADEVKEDTTSEGLARKFGNSSVADMVASYRQEYAFMEANYRAIFKLDPDLLRELSVDKKQVREGLLKRMTGLKNKYWSVLFKRLDAITSRLSTKSAEALLGKLTQSNTIEFTESNAYAVVLWAIKNANQYFDDQLIALFYELTTFEGAFKYKSNEKTWKKDGWRFNRDHEYTHYALDYRIVVSVWNAIHKDSAYSFDSYNYPGGLHRNAHNAIADIVAVMSNLGFTTNSPNTLDRTWKGGQWQEWYEGGAILFEVKGYLNGNLHLRFRPDAIKALNIEVGRLLKWVRTKEDVVTELGYTPADAEKYFGKSHQITVNIAKRLMAPDQPEPEPEPEPTPEEPQIKEPQINAPEKVTATGQITLF